MARVHDHAGQFPPENLDWQALIPLLGPAVGIARGSGRRSNILAFFELVSVMG